MKMMVSALLLFSAFLAGCQADPVAPMRNELTAPTVRSFPLKRLRLNQNTLFLWKIDQMPSDVAAQTVSRVLQLARTKTDLDDRAEELGNRAKSLNDREDALKQRRRDANLAALKLAQEIKKLDQELQQLGSDRQAAADELGKVQSQLDADQKALESEHDEKKAEALQAEIRDLTARAADRKAMIDSADQRIVAETELRKQKSTERDQKLADKAAAESEIAPIDAELQPINTELNQIQSEGSSVVGELVKTVHWYDPQPETITVEPAGKDSIQKIEIRKWGLRDGDGGRNFASDTSEIRDLSYDEKGGILRFKVVVNLNDPEAEYYTFDLARSKYGDTDRTGKAFFSGDLVRHEREADGAEIITKGAAELSGIETD